MGTDGHRLKVKYEHLFTDPGVVTNLQLPGKVDIHTGFDDYAVSNLGPKQT
jgi:hypothetical protein